MLTNIFAWTEVTPPEGFPAYVSINRDQQGKHTITVRSRGNCGRDVATIEVTPQLLESMLCSIAADLYRDDARGMEAREGPGGEAPQSPVANGDAPKVRWCNACGEGVDTFCRGKGAPCPMFPSQEGEAAGSTSRAPEPVVYVPYCFADCADGVAGEFRFADWDEKPFEVADPTHWRCEALSPTGSTSRAAAPAPEGESQ